MITLHIIAPIL